MSSQVFQSTLGKKLIMALTGLVLFGFVVGHLAGNLQIFLGPDAINSYGQFLHEKPGVLWTARVGLLVMAALHVWCAIRLAKENRAARPVPYAASPPAVAASYASRTMLMSGLIIAAFVIYHLLHFTIQAQPVNLTSVDFKALTETLPDGTARHDVYRMMVTGFRHPAVSGFYVVAMALLCLHLSHGLEAMFQSVGLRFSRSAPWIKRLAQTASWLIFLGYTSIPLAVLLGFGKEAVK